MHSSPVALVTGSSRGIGRAIALELAQVGHAVVVNYVASGDAAEQVVEQIHGSGGDAVAIQANVGSTEDRVRLLAECESHFGRLDLLVNNAGITSPGRLDLLETTEENWEKVFATNLKGPFFLAQQAARSMIESIHAGQISRGTIVNISSISAIAASTNRADYCLTKAATEMMTWLLADRLAEEKITVFEICPGIIASDMTAPVREKYDRLIAEGIQPQKRWGHPEDVARAVAALAGGAFPFCTGQRIFIDGGYHIRRL